MTSARICRAGRAFLLQMLHARLARAVAGRALFPLALSMETPCSRAFLLPKVLWSVLFLGTILSYTTPQQLVTIDRLTSVGDTESPVPIKGLLPAYIVASGSTKQAVCRGERRRKRRAAPNPGCDLITQYQMPVCSRCTTPHCSAAVKKGRGSLLC